MQTPTAPQCIATKRNKPHKSLFGLGSWRAQQQTIGQNEQNFPLTNLSNVAALMRGFTVPTSTSTTLQASPLATLAGIGAGTAGFFQPRYTTDDKLISGSTPYDAFASGLSTLGQKLGLTGGNPTLPGSATDTSGYTGNPFDSDPSSIPMDESEYLGNPFE